MRITSKGQLTIPKALRESAGLMPGTDVRVAREGGVVTIRRLERGKRDAIDERIKRFTGTGNRRFTSEALMKLLRADD